MQCLYSQCQTAHFASALHHTIEQCSEDDSQFAQNLPALIRHQGLRIRAVPSMYASASVSAPAIHSGVRRQSSTLAPGKARPTRTPASTSRRTAITPIALPTSHCARLNATIFNTTAVSSLSHRPSWLLWSSWSPAGIGRIFRGGCFITSWSGNIQPVQSGEFYPESYNSAQGDCLDLRRSQHAKKMIHFFHTSFWAANTR